MQMQSDIALKILDPDLVIISYYLLLWKLTKLYEIIEVQVKH